MSGSQPEISVIVPVYNAGEYLAPCVRSVLGQTFADWELLLVDDASTDGSLALCRSFTDPRVRVIAKDRNEGVSEARNTGLNHARGRYITFVDADDTVHPRFLEDALGACRKLNCEICVTPFRMVSPEVHFAGERSFKEPTGRVDVYDPKEAVSLALYQTGLTNCTWGMLYVARLFDKFRFRKIRYEDLDSFYRLFLRAGKIAYLPEPMYFYTMNPGSYIHTFTPERTVVLDVTERIVSFMAENHPELLPAAEDRALSAAFNIFNLLAANRCNLPEVETRCRQTIKRYRRQSLFNKHVRLKNKIGIIVTYLGGFGLLKFMARHGKN